MTLSFKDWRSGSVLVVGDVMLDRYWSGPTRRISPEAPVPVVVVDDELERVGGAANVAANVFALGAKVHLIGGVGADAAAERLAALCESGGFTADLIGDSRNETTVKLRIMSHRQQLLRLDFEAAPYPYDKNRLFDNFRRQLAHAGIVVLSDYGKGFLRDSCELIQIARRASVPVIVDPKSNDFSRYAGATVVTPNYAEFERCVGRCDNDGDVVERAVELCRAHDIESVLITRGERGMILISPGSAPLALSANAREVFDVTGAGDTVCAVLATALAAGGGLEDAVRCANAAAGIAVGKSGTATVSIGELERAMSNSGSDHGSVVSLEELLFLLEQLRRDGQKIVMTNGCFDLVHAGHIAYLEQAKALGSKLIVAINSDESVSRLKGAGRPIHKLRDRMAVVGALSAVDWVVSFDADDPGALVEAIDPDVLVKGGDYAVEEIVGAEHVLGRGGEVVSLPFVDGLSTTRVIEQLAHTRPVDAPGE